MLERSKDGMQWNSNCKKYKKRKRSRCKNTRLERSLIMVEVTIQSMANTIQVKRVKPYN